MTTETNEQALLEMNRSLRSKLGIMTRFLIVKGYCPVCLKHLNGKDKTCGSCLIIWKLESEK